MQLVSSARKMVRNKLNSYLVTFLALTSAGYDVSLSITVVFWSAAYDYHCWILSLLLRQAAGYVSSVVPAESWLPGSKCLAPAHCMANPEGIWKEKSQQDFLGFFLCEFICSKMAPYFPFFRNLKLFPMLGKFTFVMWGKSYAEFS